MTDTLAYPIRFIFWFACFILAIILKLVSWVISVASMGDEAGATFGERLTSPGALLLFGWEAFTFTLFWLFLRFISVRGYINKIPLLGGVLSAGDAEKIDEIAKAFYAAEFPLWRVDKFVWTFIKTQFQWWDYVIRSFIVTMLIMGSLYLFDYFRGTGQDALIIVIVITIIKFIIEILWIGIALTGHGVYMHAPSHRVLLGFLIIVLGIILAIFWLGTIA